MLRAFFVHSTHRMLSLFWILLLICVPFAFSPVSAQSLLPRTWMNPALTPDERADQLLAQMTLDEKITMVHGAGGSYVGNIPANTRLGIPALNLEDGPAGVSDGMTQVTAFPAPVAAAASWNTTLMKQYGQNLANEEAGKGTNIHLAPTVNILRNPQWGRSFESFGEDPYLTSQLGVADIQGIQSQGVIATVKHYAANNQEYNRTSVDENVDERTLHEIYLPAFEAAVKQGQVGSVMCAYNRVNTFYACEQPYLLNEVLKQNWGFQGFVMSDWGATHSTAQAANAGLDMQMPDASFFGDALKSAINNGEVSIDTLNTMVHRILRTMFAIGLFDKQPTGSPGNNVTSQAHTDFARQTAEQGTVLLKNNQNILPLDRSKIKTIAVIGADASTSPTIAGGGSAAVNAPYVVTPLQGITQRAGNGVTINYTDQPSQAAQTASNADVAIVFVDAPASEGSDLGNLSLPNNQDSLVQTVAQANPHTIVVLNTGSAALMPWVDQVQGVVEAWYPGQEDGNAIASVLFGDVNPSGKLPMTFPKQESDVPANTPQQYPGINDEAQYSEGVFVGYRHYDAQNITPLFPFGHGLSYTTFDYSNIAISPSSASATDTLKVELDVKNTGSRSGTETVQLYLGIPATAVAEPPKQLKGFQKVTLDAGQTQHVTFSLNPSDLSYWDTGTHNWVTQNGTYQVQVGSSSRDIRLQGSFSIGNATYSSLQQAYNNVGTSDDNNAASGNFDGHGYSYSAQQLAAAGLTPGGTLTHNGIAFTWPNVSSGQPNNVATAGQSIALTGSGSTLGFLGAAAFGTQSGTGTITYTDNSTQQFTVSFADWYDNAAASGDDLIATAANWNQPPGSTLGSHAVSVYYTSVSLQSNKTIQSVTLPNNSNLHIFSLALDNPLQSSFNNVGTSNDNNASAGNLDGHGYSYSAQQLAAAGLTPGGTLTHKGITFTWPNIASGQNNNVSATGQKIAFPRSGSTLAFLGTATLQTQSGAGTITYTDNSTQQFTLSFADWYANKAITGDDLIATAANWNLPSGSTLGAHAVSVYYASVALQTGKAIQTVTLPNNGNLHIFAMATG